MQMFSVQLGKMKIDGFALIESSNLLASDWDSAKQRAIDILKTRGKQLGANKVRLVAGDQTREWEYP
jgi:hypothetical protein